MDFKHYHTSAEIEMWMRKWADQYPDITSLYRVGEAFSGRPIWQMTFTNKKTGRDTDKPAAFFEGGRHSGEISGTESTLYLMWYLLENYGKDAAVTKLIDENAIYLRPLNNPDGSDMYRLTAQANRSTVRPNDDDGDGLLDEDPGEDLDGDGFIRQMRKKVEMGKGQFMLDPKDPSGRLLTRAPAGKGDYQTWSEGVDNDLDGVYNEDGVGGLDLHRNYPMNWRPMPGGDLTGRGFTQGGAGAYPLSEPETKSVVLFLLSHPNVAVANSMDTAVPMHLRPPSTCEETECMYQADLKIYQRMDSIGLSFTNYPWAGDVYRTYATREPVNAFTGDSSRPAPLFGHGPDFGYFYFGSVWYGDEIWNGGREKDYDGDKKIDSWEVLKYCDEAFGGKCFMPWAKFTHSVLGEVEIGGFNPKFWSQNGPPEVLEKWAKNQALFNLTMAYALPKVEIVSAEAKEIKNAKDSATHEIKVVVRNSGKLPTALEQAKRVKIVQPDRVVAQPARGSATRSIGRAPEFWLGAGQTQTITLRIKSGEKPEDRKATLRLLSTRGGVAEREITW
ncbi:MAG: peptidase [Gemmatimonadales bacterium]|nr:peptidase [Gemmatimonadales bacterium]